MYKLASFVFFNSLFPLGDVGTDAYTAYDLYQDGHDYWASLTFYLVWNPFVVHLLQFLWHAGLAWWNNKVSEFDWVKRLKYLAIRLPFVFPFVNLYGSVHLRRLGFGRRKLSPKESKIAEEIQREAGLISVQESFMEAGPQTVVQLVKVFSTGHISYAQIASLVFSFLILAYSSAKVFFILRTKDESDPDPDFKMLLLRIVPWELLIVTNSAIFWTMIGGLLGEYILVGILFTFLSTYGVLYIQELRNPSADSEEDFKFLGALTSVWLPCVVGNPKSKFFLYASIASLASKVILLLFALLLCKADILDTKPILIWCKNAPEIELKYSFRQSMRQSVHERYGRYWVTQSTGQNDNSN